LSYDCYCFLTLKTITLINMFSLVNNSNCKLLSMPHYFNLQFTYNSNYYFILTLNIFAKIKFNYKKTFFASHAFWSKINKNCKQLHFGQKKEKKKKQKKRNKKKETKTKINKQQTKKNVATFLFFFPSKQIVPAGVKILFVLFTTGWRKLNLSLFVCFFVGLVTTFYVLVKFGLES